MEVLVISRHTFLAIMICLDFSFVLASATNPANGRQSSNAVDDADDVDSKISAEERFNHIPPRVLSTMMRLTERAPGIFKNVDTIRAYTPTTHRLCGDHVVSLFNVRLYPYSEALQALELHYYKVRSLRHRRENFQAIVWAFPTNSDTECMRLGSVNLQASRHGYQTTDITSEVTQQWDSLPEEMQVGISFSTSRDGDAAGLSRSEAAVNTLSTRPFILIYTKQKQSLNIDTLQQIIEKSDRIREKRSLIQGMEDDDDDDDEFIANEQQELSKRSSVDPEQLTFSYFNNQSKRRRKLLKQQRKMQKEKRRQDVDEEDGGELISNEITNNELPLPISERKCRRYPLNVNFRDLGWSDFVIAPRQYNAYFCTGTCSKPTKQNISPTNHAAILNVMNTLGAASVPLPAPCCVPDKMTSLNVLYFREDDRIILQTFSNMQVESCGCR